MPTLHRFTDREGHYIKGISQGKPLALELTPEGEQYITETLGLSAGSKFGAETFRWLYKKKWAVPLSQPLPDEPVVLSSGESPGSSSEPNPVVFPGVLHLEIASADQVTLDIAVQTLIRALLETGTKLEGPLPLPVHIDRYTVLRDATRTNYDLRKYRRVLEIRAPRKKTVEVMQKFSLPRLVDLQVNMVTAG